MSYGQGPDSEYNAIINKVDEYGRTRLHEAAIIGKTDDIRHLLIGGFDPSLPDMNGRTPLHYAALQGNSLSILRVLNYTKPDAALLLLRVLCLSNNNLYIYRRSRARRLECSYGRSCDAHKPGNPGDQDSWLQPIVDFPFLPVLFQAGPGTRQRVSQAVIQVPGRVLQHSRIGDGINITVYADQSVIIGKLDLQGFRYSDLLCHWSSSRGKFDWSDSHGWRFTSGQHGGQYSRSYSFLPTTADPGSALSNGCLQLAQNDFSDFMVCNPH